MGNSSQKKLNVSQEQCNSNGSLQKRSNSTQLLHNGNANKGRNAKKNAFNAIANQVSYLTNNKDAKSHHKYIEGHLMKYKPLISSKYIQRYCFMTLTDFICCNKEWNAYSYACKPILQIPISSIEVVHRYAYYQD